MRTRTMGSAAARAWRNWQTRRTQNPVLVTECRFDPDRPHQGSLSLFTGQTAMKASTSFSGLVEQGLSVSASLGQIWSATRRHWALAVSALSWAKAVAIDAGTTRRRSCTMHAASPHRGASKEERRLREE